MTTTPPTDPQPAPEGQTPGGPSPAPPLGSSPATPGGPITPTPPEPTMSAAGPISPGGPTPIGPGGYAATPPGPAGGTPPAQPPYGQPVDPIALLATPPVSAAPIPAPRSGGKLPVLTLVLGGIVVLGLGFGGGFLTGQATSDGGTDDPVSASSCFFPGQDGQSGRVQVPDLPGGGVGGGQNDEPPATDDGAQPIRPGNFPGAIQGEITSISGDTVTIKQSDGTEVTVTTKSSTAVTDVSSISPGDLGVGDTVTVMGTTGDDGDMTAQSITRGEASGQFAMVLRGGDRADAADDADDRTDAD